MGDQEQTRIVPTIRRATLDDAAQIAQVYQHVGTRSGTLELPMPSAELWRACIHSHRFCHRPAGPGERLAGG
jgi:hypothetical protein